MAITEYRDFQLSATQRPNNGASGNEFTIQVDESPAGEGAPQTVTVPADLQSSLAELEFDAPAFERVVEIGETLADILLCKDEAVRGLYYSSLTKLKEHQGLRLRLRLDPALGDIPWEYMYIPRGGGKKNITGFLALDQRISIVRHEALGFSGDLKETSQDLRVLVALANPTNYAKLDLTKEKANIERALENLPGIKSDFVEKATLERLHEKLQHGADIFHFAGHGAFSETGLPQNDGSMEGRGAIALVNDKGEARLMPADTLAVNLLGRGVQLVILVACETGRRDGKNFWTSVAAGLVQAEVPAVVAMQYKIADASALEFSRSFYRALAGGLSLEQAVHEGRLAILNFVDPRRNNSNYRSSWRDWGVPVLYYRSQQEWRLRKVSIPVLTSKKAAVTVDLPKNVAANMKHFTGRAWVLPLVLEWLEKTTPRTLIITGNLGTGKSMLMAWLAGAKPLPDAVEAQEQLAKIHAHIKGVYYCNAMTLNTDPKKFALNIHEQLQNKIETFKDAFRGGDGMTASDIIASESGGRDAGLRHDELLLRSLPEVTLFDMLLWKPLKKLWQNGYQQPIILLIDALNEALEHPGPTNLVELLAKTEDLPENVRFLITTPHEPQVLNHFPQAASFDLIKNKKNPKTKQGNDADVRQYAYERLGGLSEPRRQEFAERISELSKGVFWEAQHRVNNLSAQLAENSAIKNILPPGEQMVMYRESFQQKFGKKTREQTKPAREVLGLIAVAQAEGLSRTQLERILDREVDDELDACLQFLSYDDAHAGPFLLSEYLAGFLLDKSNTVFPVNATFAHRKIAHYYWGAHQSDWRNCEAYGLNHLALHLSKDRDPASLQKLQALITNEWRQIRFKNSGNRYNGFLADVELAWEAMQSQAGANWPALIRLQTARRVANSQTNVFTDTDLKTLVWLQREEEALEHARRRDMPWEKFDDVLAIYNASQERGNPDSNLLKEMESLSAAVKNIDWKNTVLQSLAIALFQAGRRDEAERIARSLPEKEQREKTLEKFTTEPPAEEDEYSIEDFELALQVARTTQKNPDSNQSDPKKAKAEQLREFAVKVKKAGDSRANLVFKEAWEAACAIDSLPRRAEALSDLALAMARFSEPSAHAVFNQAQEIAYARAGYKHQANALISIAIASITLGRIKEAEAILDSDHDKTHQAFAAPKLSIAYAAAGQLVKAFELVDSIQDDVQRAETLMGVVMALAKRKEHSISTKLNEAFTLAYAIANRNEKARTAMLRDLGVALAMAGDNRARAAFDDAIKAIDAANHDELTRVFEWCDLAIALKQVDDGRVGMAIDQAEKMARAVAINNNDEASGASAFCKIAATCAKIHDGRTSELLEKARKLAHLTGQSLPLCHLAEALIDAELHDEAEQVILAFQDDETRLELMRKLAGSLARNKRFSEALIKLGPRSLDKFLLVLGEWSPLFHEIKNGLAIEILREAISVAGWVRPDWQKVYELIST